MLQFLLGASTLNVNWLLDSLFGGLRLYNSPPLFFIGVFSLLATRFYSFGLRPEILRFIAVIAAIGMFAGFRYGFDSWHLRQAVAFVAAATIWVFVYQEGWRRDIFTLPRTKVILAVYVVYLVIVLFEQLIHTSVLPYLVSCVFSWACGANVGYLETGRVPYFSVEASASVLAISAIIMPYICANVIVNRSGPALALFALSCIVLHFAGGFTPQIFILFSVAYILFPRLTVLGVPAVMVIIVLISAAVSYVLNQPGGITDLVQYWFGGYTATLDAGIGSGSYVTRAMNWVIGARAFLSSPIIGLGIGGTQSFFYQLNDLGYYIVLNAEQSNIVEGDMAPYNSPMVVRIPAEIGIIGTCYIVYYGWRAFRLALDRTNVEPLLHYAFLYSLGAMLLSFCVAGELLNPCIPAFVALLAQVLRAREGLAPVPAQARVQVPALAPGLG